MHRNRILIIASLCLLISMGAFVSYRSFSSTEVRPNPPVADPIKEIAGYRSWPKVNAEPQLMPDPIAALCAPVRPIGNGLSPHSNKYITVYVNETGRKPMMEQAIPTFPEGSVIVKEKLAERTSQSPELLTVMIKHSKGFNPSSGDWEYMVVDGKGTSVQARGKLESCEACHAAQPKMDYVFRTYLSSEAIKELK